jgi:hypothetical protein
VQIVYEEFMHSFMDQAAMIIFETKKISQDRNYKITRPSRGTCGIVVRRERMEYFVTLI